MAFNDGVKSVTLVVLRDLLAALPADAQIVANALGNLVVYSGIADAGGRLAYFGYIDFANDCFVAAEDDT